MFTLDDVLQSFLQPPRLNSRFEDTIKTFRKSHHEEWEDRVTRCSKSILTAACFRETAIASRESSDSMIYQPIGLYYAMYHLSMAMCWINPRLKCTELRGMQHSRLLGILKSQFVQGGLIDESIVDTFLALKNI
jgi:hypothetical protein